MPLHNLFTSETVSAGSYTESEYLPLRPNFPLHSIYYKVTGSGTLRIKVYIAFHDGDDVLVATYSNLTGTGIKSMALKAATRIKFRIEETGGADPITVDLWFLQTGGDDSELGRW